MSAYGPQMPPGPVQVQVQVQPHPHFPLARRWAFELDLGLAPSTALTAWPRHPSFVLRNFRYLNSGDRLHERYYRNRGSSSCCEASRDHLNLAKIGGTGFALRATAAHSQSNAVPGPAY